MKVRRRMREWMCVCVRAPIQDTAGTSRRRNPPKRKEIKPLKQGTRKDSEEKKKTKGGGRGKQEEPIIQQDTHTHTQKGAAYCLQ